MPKVTRRTRPTAPVSLLSDERLEMPPSNFGPTRGERAAGVDLEDGDAELLRLVRERYLQDVFLVLAEGTFEALPATAAAGIRALLRAKRPIAYLCDRNEWRGLVLRVFEALAEVADETWADVVFELVERGMGDLLRAAWKHPCCHALADGVLAAALAHSMPPCIDTIIYRTPELPTLPDELPVLGLYDRIMLVSRYVIELPACPPELARTRDAWRDALHWVRGYERFDIEECVRIIGDWELDDMDLRQLRRPDAWKDPEAHAIALEKLDAFTSARSASPH